MELSTPGAETLVSTIVRSDFEDVSGYERLRAVIALQLAL